MSLRSRRRYLQAMREKRDEAATSAPDDRVVVELLPEAYTQGDLERVRALVPTATVYLSDDLADLAKATDCPAAQAAQRDAVAQAEALLARLQRVSG